ncbi:MAG: M15 family metallopeptidase [Treponemataceae bacterium]
MKKSYPDNFVSYGFSFEKGLFYFKLKNDKEKRNFFYIHGRFLPQEHLKNWKDYQPVYSEDYPKQIPDPAKFSKYKTQRILSLAQREQRRLAKPNSFIFIQNFIYDAEKRVQIEKHLICMDFLGCKVTIHKKIKNQLKNVEKKLKSGALSDPKIAKFVNQRHIITGYNWREIRDTYQRSSHSWGISIDYIPVGQTKQMYWRWVQGDIGDKWLFQPLSFRWIPDTKIIEIFESEGFIWGGKWDLWDNMHFEYHPELI